MHATGDAAMVGGSGAALTLDTNVIIRMCDDDKFAAHVVRCIGSGAHDVIINSRAVSELERHGLSMKMVPAVLGARLGIDAITYDVVSDDERRGAAWLEKRHETLHRGDSDILAFAHVRGLVLVTCDNGLVRAARDVGVKCINPCVTWHGRGAGPRRGRAAKAAGRG